MVKDTRQGTGSPVMIQGKVMRARTEAVTMWIQRRPWI